MRAGMEGDDGVGGFLRDSGDDGRGVVGADHRGSCVAVVVRLCNTPQALSGGRWKVSIIKTH